MSEADERMKEVFLALGREDQQAAENKILYDLAAKQLFGDISKHSHLSPRDRELTHLAAIAGLASQHGSHSHYRTALSIGITKEQIMELIIHVGAYAGWATMGIAAKQLRAVLKEKEDAGKASKTNEPSR